MVAKRCHDVDTDRELVVNPRHIVIIHVTVYGKEKSLGPVFNLADLLSDNFGSVAAQDIDVSGGFLLLSWISELFE